MKESESVSLSVMSDFLQLHGPARLLSMGFSRQEYWSGLPFPSPGDLRNPGIKSGSLALQAESLLSDPPGKLMFNAHSSMDRQLSYENKI